MPREEPTPLDRALRLLAVRDHSVHDLTRKLTARGVAPDDAAAAIARLHELGYLNDDRLATAEVARLVAAGYGPLHVRQRMRRAGFDAAAVEALIAAHVAEGAVRAACARAFQKRFGASFVPKDAKERARVLRFLFGRGFESDDVRAVMAGGPGAAWDDDYSA